MQVSALTSSATALSTVSVGAPCLATMARISLLALGLLFVQSSVKASSSFPLPESLSGSFGPASGIQQSGDSANFVWVSSERIYGIERNFQGIVMTPQFEVFPGTKAFKPTVKDHPAGRIVGARGVLTNTQRVISRLYKGDTADPMRQHAQNVDLHDWDFFPQPSGSVLYGYTKTDTPYFEIDNPVSKLPIKGSTPLFASRAGLYNSVGEITHSDGSMTCITHQYSGGYQGFVAQKITSSGGRVGGPVTWIATGSSRPVPFSTVSFPDGSGALIWATVTPQDSVTGYQVRKIEPNGTPSSSATLSLASGLSLPWNGKQRILDAYGNQDGTLSVSYMDGTQALRVTVNLETRSVSPPESLADSQDPRNIFSAPVESGGWIGGWGNDTGPFAMVHLPPPVTTTTTVTPKPVTSTTTPHPITTTTKKPKPITTTTTPASTPSSITTTTTTSPPIRPKPQDDPVNGGLIAAIVAIALACLGGLGTGVWCIARRRNLQQPNVTTPLKQDPPPARSSQYAAAPSAPVSGRASASHYDSPTSPLDEGDGNSGGVHYGQLLPAPKVEYSELGPDGGT